MTSWSYLTSVCFYSQWFSAARRSRSELQQKQIRRGMTEENRHRRSDCGEYVNVGYIRKLHGYLCVCACDIVVEARPHPREEVKGHGAEQRNRGMFGQRLKDIRK